jgi:BirA family transcriptional regulator, biotin operon repressor / biotin---[acetyl-CoA-carboxylase] ligase
MERSTSPSSLILLRLKEKQGDYLSGTDLAAELSMTRTGIWKHIQSLSAKGYVIDRLPRRGYRLVSCTDLLLPEEVLPLLHTTWLGQTYLHHMETGSTNQDAMILATQGGVHGTVVVAEHQRAGRGRLRRNWDSPKKFGIYVSMLFTRSIAANRAPQCPLVMALALTRILRSRYGLEAAVKWPNDVLVQGRKVSGVLAEMQLDQDEVRHMVVGVGINVNQDERDFAGGFRYPPTSLSIELKRKISRKEVLIAFLEEAELAFDHLAANGFSAFLDEFEAVSAIVGQEVSVQTGTKTLVGMVRGFTQEGALRLMPKDTQAETIIWVGDVTSIAGEFMARNIDG